MPRLDPKERANLPDRAFAYIDSTGRRRLPIHDASHVRNALTRFGQVSFEDDAAREQARMRLLNAAKKFKIVPVGFIAGQLQRRARAEPRSPVELPSGFVTMLMTDIEGSTALVQHAGAALRELIDTVWSILRKGVLAGGGHEVEARADEFFAVFESPRAAIDAAIALQLELRPTRGSTTTMYVSASASTAVTRRRPIPTTWAWMSTPPRGSARSAMADKSSCRRTPANG